MQDQATTVVCHPMLFKGSCNHDEREKEDHDGFFEPWSHEKLEASPTNGLEITVGFLAVKTSGSYHAVYYRYKRLEFLQCHVGNQ
jgi:hypothetical protein